VQDSHNLSSTNEHVLTGSSLLAAYTVKNTFIDFTDPESGNMRAAARKFRTDQPMSISLQYDTDMQLTESLVQEFKDEIQIRQRENTSSSAKFENQDKTRQSSRKGEKSFFKQLMSATNTSDLLGKATSSSKPASSLQPSTSYKTPLPETSAPLPQNIPFAIEAKSGTCLGNEDLESTDRSDVDMARQQMPPPGLCEVGPSEIMTEKVDACMLISEDEPCLVDNHGPLGATLFGQHLLNSNTVAMSDDQNFFGSLKADPQEGKYSPHLSCASPA